MRVLHLTSEYPPLVWGGLGTVVGGLTKASARAGMIVDVLFVRHELNSSYGHPMRSWTVAGPRAESTSDIGAPVTIFQVSHQSAIRAGLRLVCDRRPDVIHVHPVELWPIAKAIKQATEIPIVYTVHSLNLAEYAFGNEPPEILNLWHAQRELVAEADRILVLTEDERRLLLDSCPLVRDRVVVVGNGIDDDPTALHAATTRKQNHPPLVLFTGRFVDRKGIHELFRAIPLVLRTAPEIEFLLVGGYGSATDVERCWLPAELYEFRSQIRFTGWLNTTEVGNWYRQADILVVPLWYEPFGMVVLEGMLYGLPVAASNVGGPAEILRHRETGLMFPPRDVEALAAAILELGMNPGLRHHLGVTAAMTVRERWLWPKIVNEIARIYQQVM